MKRILSSFRRNRDKDVNQAYVATHRDDCWGEDKWFWWPLILPSSFD